MTQIYMEYELFIMVDSIKSTNDAVTELEQIEAFSSNGEPIEAYQKKRYPRQIMTVTHNGISKRLDELNNSWYNIAKDLPFKFYYLSFSNGALECRGEIYSMNQFNLVVDTLEKFLNEMFNCKFNIKGE